MDLEPKEQVPCCGQGGSTARGGETEGASTPPLPVEDSEPPAPPGTDATPAQSCRARHSRQQMAVATAARFATTSRNIFILLASVLALLTPLAGGSGALQENDEVAFNWRVPAVHLDTVKNVLEFQGSISPEEKTKGGPLVFILTGLVLLPNLADSILALRREIIHGGVVIDTRGKDIKITSDQRLDGGVMVVISDEGTRIYEREELWNASELIKAINPAHTNPAELGRGCALGR